MLTKRTVNEILEEMKKIIQQIIDEPEVGVQDIISIEIVGFHRDMYKLSKTFGDTVSGIDILSKCILPVLRNKIKEFESHLEEIIENKNQH